MTTENRYDDLEVTDMIMQGRRIIILWASPTLGFGELMIGKDHSDAIIIDHEQMSADFCKAVMNKFIDKYYTP